MRFHDNMSLWCFTLALVTLVTEANITLFLLARRPLFALTSCAEQAMRKSTALL